MYDSSDIRDGPSTTQRCMDKMDLLYRHYLDRTVPHITTRWIVCAIFVTMFCLRIIWLQGFYVVTYAVFIYYLSLLLSFLTPLIDPALDVADEGPALPTNDPSSSSRGSDEFRPFERSLPEFKCWYAAMKTTALAYFCTFFSFFDIPVFWPILVIYFIFLTLWSLKHQIAHMIKYKYVPFNIGKPRHTRNRDVNYYWRM